MNDEVTELLEFASLKDHIVEIEHWRMFNDVTK